MKLIYCLVGKGGRILHSYSNSSGNFAAIASDILNKKEIQGDVTYGSATFYWLFDSGYQYLCLGEKLSQKHASIFLNRIKELWVDYCGSPSAVFNKDFTRMLQYLMENLIEKFMQDIVSNIENEQNSTTVTVQNNILIKQTSDKIAKKLKKKEKKIKLYSSMATDSLLDDQSQTPDTPRREIKYTPVDSRDSGVYDPMPPIKNVTSTSTTTEIYILPRKEILPDSLSDSNTPLLKKKNTATTTETSPRSEKSNVTTTTMDIEIVSQRKFCCCSIV